MILLSILIFSCQNNSDSEVLFDLSKAKNHPPDSLFLQLGEITERDDYAGKYPCEKSDCLKLIFQDGKYEVITRNNKLEWITINNIPDYSGNHDALQFLGLPSAPPDFINPGFVARWENYNGIYRISFFPDYALIIFRKPD